MPNSFYTHSSYPSPNSAGSSSLMRAEFDLITAGFNKLPTLAGNGYKVVGINAAGTAMIADPQLMNVDFSTTNTAGNVVGRLSWNDTDGTLNLGLKGGNVTLQIGQEQNVRIYNETAVGFVDMQVVRITGSSGTRLTADLAKADAESTSASTIAIMTEPCLSHGEGFATTFGLIRDINTLAFAEGATLYLSTTVSGGITTTKPSAPNHTVILGWCVRSHGTQGVIYVNISNGHELDELHDVLITSVAANNMLRRNAANTVWENIAGPAGAIVGTTDTQTLTNKTFTSPTITSAAISGGTIDNVTIGGTTAAAGTFTTLAATSATVGGAAVTTATNTQTLTNKTLTAPVIGTIINTGTLTLPTSTDTLIGRATTDTLTNKTISGSSNTLSNIGNSSLTNSSVTIGSTSVSLGATVTTIAGLTLTTPTIAAIVNGGTLTLPSGTDTLVSRASTDTLTNKTLSGANNTFSNIPNTAITGLGTMSTQSSSSVTITGGSITGITDLLVADGGTGSSTASGARANLLPTFAGNAGKVMAVNAGATDVEYITVGGTGTVTSITAGTGLTGGAITTAGTIAIDTTVVATLSGTQTLTNKTISGASNTLSNIGNSSLTNSSVTVNGSSVSLGGSVTVTATATNALTIGTGLSGTSYNGSGAVTVAIDSTVATLTGSQVLTNKTIEAATFTNGYTEESVTANTSTAYTIDLANGTSQILTLTGSATITMPTATAGKSFMVFLKTGSGSFTCAFTGVKWAGGIAPTVTTTASRMDIFSFFADGTNWYGVAGGQNYTP